jgi:hypothetical protein
MTQACGTLELNVLRPRAPKYNRLKHGSRMVELIRAARSVLADGVLRSWPDGIDAAALLFYAVIAFGLPLVGYGIMALDIRRYLRSLRRALMVIAGVASPTTPSWAQQDDPPCLQALDLMAPCTEEEVLAAYRLRVKALHPDRGGDLQQFLRLQKHFEQAMYLAKSGTGS